MFFSVSHRRTLTIPYYRAHIYIHTLFIAIITNNFTPPRLIIIIGAFLLLAFANALTRVIHTSLVYYYLNDTLIVI